VQILSNRVLPLALVTLLLVTSLAPLAAGAQGRSTPDFVISSFTLDDAGSITLGGAVEVEDATHIVRIQVQNIGLAAGQASLALLLQGSSSSGDIVIDSTNLGVIAAGASSSVTVFSWAATIGNNQILKAKVTGATDVNPNNNQEQLLVNVSRYQDSSVPVVNIPQPASGGASVVWSQSVHDFSIGVRNDGVKNHSAQFFLNFTQVGTGTTFSAASTIVPVVRPGSLYNGGATPETVSMSFDATSQTGEWDVVGTMFAQGVDWTEDVEFLNFRVVFSNYDFRLTAAHDRSVEPGQTSTLTFLLKNIGAASDDYIVSQSNVNGWVSSITPSGQTATISPNVTTSVFVQVAVPADALRTDSEIVTLTVQSNGGGVSKSVSTTVLASELYEGHVEMDSDSKSLTPGQSTTLQVKVENTGNAPTSFTLNAGISTNPLNWDLDLSSASTGTLAPGASVNVSLAVTPPVIKRPLVPAEYNRAGDAMSVWVQAASTNGGVPHLNATPVSILPVIVVDPGLPTDAIDMTVEQVMQARQGMGLEEILDLEVEVRHNLVSDLTETVNATLTLGSPVFTSDSSGGFDEVSRWAVGLTPSLFPYMDLGDTADAVMTVQGPADDYPVSGTLSVLVTATPTLGSVHLSSGVIPSSVTQSLDIRIPPVLGAVGHNGTTLDAMVGEETAFDISIANTGNNMTSYRLIMADSLPDGWVASFSSSALMPSTTVASVPADVADYPSNDTAHIKTFPLVITTDSMAPANSVETLRIEVQEMNSGVYITEFDVPIRVGEKVNAELTPTSQEVNLSIGDSITTSVVVSNVGNTPAVFNVWLDTSQAGEVEYVLETPTVIAIGAGYESTVRVRLTPTDDALAATDYKATVWVSNLDSGLNLSADILGNISEQHGISVDTLDEIGVIPGEPQTVNYSITNNGNLVENIVIETTVSSNWSVSPSSIPLTLAVGATDSGTLVIDIPALGGEDNLLNGATHAVTMRVLNASTQEVLKTHRFNLIVAPLFIVEVEDWPLVKYYHRGYDRTWDVTITNTGNKDVEVNLTYTLLQGGLTLPSTDWEVANNAPSTIMLQRNTPTQLSFVVRSVAPQPPLTLAANLILSLDPVDENVQGSAAYYTELRMDRFHQESETPVNPIGPTVFTIDYSHIPTGPESAVAYELELCAAERLLDLESLDLEQNLSLFDWSFALVVGGSEYPLDLDEVCPPSGSLGADSRLTLPTRQPWVTSDPIQLKVTAPASPNILSDDGWDLTFRLYHPGENNGYTNFDEETFTYKLAVFSDPGIIAQGPEHPDEFFEGQETTYSVTIKNHGTAQALGITASLDCHGDVVILSQPDMLPLLVSQAEHTFEWSVQPATIDWWEVSKEIQCDASLSYLYVGEGNREDNDVSHRYTKDGSAVELGQETVRSWSPDLSVAFIACAVAFLISFIFVRLSSQSEKWQLGGIYAGVLGFGFAFHLFQVSYWGPAVLVLGALWIWRMTWKSSEEFRLIHEDYQRARKGTSTVYSDHFAALTDSRRQLTIILSLPVLGMLAIVLGLPPQLATNQDNLVVMAAYFFAIMLGVWYLLKRSDKLYGNLYGRMTDAEVKSIRLERDLNDPARLLNDLADDGLDFTAMLSGGDEARGINESEGLDGGKQPVGDLDFSSAMEVDADA
jgi:uncharacterized membrane protein